MIFLYDFPQFNSAFLYNYLLFQSVLTGLLDNEIDNHFMKYICIIREVILHMHAHMHTHARKHTQAHNTHNHAIRQSHMCIPGSKMW